MIYGHNVAAILVAAVCLPACAVTKRDFNDAASIGYRLPETEIQLTLDLVLTDCTSRPQAKARVSATPVVRSSPHAYRLEGSGLTSFTKQRHLTIDLYTSGAIKSINGGVSDKTGAIIVNLIETATAIATIAAAHVGPTGSQCTPYANDALDAVFHFSRKIKELQKQLESEHGADPIALRTQIDAYAAEVGRIETDRLSIHLSRTIPFDETTDVNKQTGTKVVMWNISELGKWLYFDKKSPAETLVGNFSLSHSVVPMPVDWMVKHDPAVSPTNGDCPMPDSKCETTIVFREPVDAELTVTAARDDLGGKAGDQLRQVAFPMAQWGDFSFLSLSVGFGGSKTFALGLDEFGRRTSFTWSSSARGEDITGGLQGIVESAGALKQASTDAELNAQKAQLDRMQTQLELNKLLECQAILDAGGFKCPEE